MKIIKRSGEEQIFDLEKIVNAISKANITVAENLRLSDEQIQNIAKIIENDCSESSHIESVEEVQDMVEKEIMKLGYYEVAKNYITYRKFTERIW